MRTAIEQHAQVRPPNAAERVVPLLFGAAPGGPCAFAVLLLMSVGIAMDAFAAEKKRPQGHGENEIVALSATILSQEHVELEFGTGFHGSYTVLEVRLTPKGQAMEVNLDDFILRSESDGDHSGPLAAAQIVDGGALVIKRTYSPRTNAAADPLIAGTKVEMKDDLSKGVSGTPEMIEALKKRILKEGQITEPESGLLFFPLEKKRPGSLVLSYAAPGGKLRIQFK